MPRKKPAMVINPRLSLNSCQYRNKLISPEQVKAFGEQAPSGVREGMELCTKGNEEVAALKAEHLGEANKLVCRTFKFTKDQDKLVKKLVLRAAKELDICSSKTEIIRAGIIMLAKMTDAQFGKAVMLVHGKTNPGPRKLKV